MDSAYQEWVGRPHIIKDTLSTGPVQRLAATIGLEAAALQEGDELPPCWHWLFFLEAASAAQISTDGHPERGGFLPPVTLPRRMWAASELEFHSPLLLGDRVRRESTITDVTAKRGRSGELVFVSVQHEIYRGDTLLLTEGQDIVYREAASGGTGAGESMPEGDWSLSVTPAPVLLFRYSALTFNAHRIHYDRDYAVQQEGYDGLVVQGPLTATLLLDLLRREAPGERLHRFRFRGVRPLTDGQTLELRGSRREKTVELWAGNSQGLGMRAEAELA